MKTKNMFLIGFLSLACAGWILLARNASAEHLTWSVEDNIENARQIWEIEKINGLDESGPREKLLNYLQSDRVPVARAAVRRLAIIDSDRGMEILKETHHKSELVQTTIRLALTILRGSSAETGIQNAIAFIEDSSYSSHVGVMPVVDDANAICRSKGWGDRLPGEYAYGLKEYSGYKEETGVLSRADKIVYLIDKVWNFDQPRQRDAAMNILIDDIGKDAIPPLLAKLEDHGVLPSSSGPPYDKSHTRYHAMINLIISIPDDRSLPLLNKLAQSENPYVAGKARDAIKWVTSGIPFPFKYERLMIVNPSPGDYTR